MKVEKYQTDTYSITEVNGLDEVIVYVTNYGKAAGRIVIECFCRSWVTYWGSMGTDSLQEFFLSCNDQYIVDRLVPKHYETDFAAINSRLPEFTSINSEEEIGANYDLLAAAFGEDWYTHGLPCKLTEEYLLVKRIVQTIREAFKSERENLDE